jgi:hypothetical protein
VRLRAAIAAKQAELFHLVYSGANSEALGRIDKEIAPLEEAHRKLLGRISEEAPQLQELTHGL